jgi:hypothetical protein
MMANGVEFYPESVFAVRTHVESVFERDGIEDCEGGRESEKEEEKPARADMSSCPVEAIEEMHSESDA